MPFIFINLIMVFNLLLNFIINIQLVLYYLFINNLSYYLLTNSYYFVYMVHDLNKIVNHHNFFNK